MMIRWTSRGTFTSGLMKTYKIQLLMSHIGKNVEMMGLYISLLCFIDLLFFLPEMLESQKPISDVSLSWLFFLVHQFMIITGAL